MSTKKRRSAAPPAAPPSPPSASGRWLRALAALLLLLPWAWGVSRSMAIKVSEHVRLELMGPVIPQGEEPGKISAVAAIRGAEDGSFYTVSRIPGPGCRIQHFGEDGALLTWLDLPYAKSGVFAGLAVLPGGGLRLASEDGRLWALAPDLDPKSLAPLKSPLSAVSDLEAAAPDRLVALDRASGRLSLLDAAGGDAELDSAKIEAGAAVNLARCKDGLALLLRGSRRFIVQIYNPALQLQHRFSLPAPELSQPDVIGASGSVLMVNDAAGARGVCFYHLDGRGLGNAVGAGADPITHAGFAAGNPAGGRAFIHYGAGLIRVRLPWGEDQ